MAAKKTSRSKKGVAKAKATRKSSTRSARKAPKGQKPGNPIELIDVF